MEIRPIRDSEVDGALEIIIGVAHRLFAPGATLESFRDLFMGVDGELADVYQHATVYGPPDGLFLVALDDGRVVGTGAVRRLDETTAELKRMWLLDEYQGQGVGYQMIQQLMSFAREHGYQKVMLTTTQLQVRALAFYRKIGFEEVPITFVHPEVGEGLGVQMEMPL